MKTSTLSALVVVTSLATATGALAQDVAAGKSSFNKCMACHAIGEGAKNKVGPVLNGLEGRKSGTVEGYSYSDANKNSGITWSKDTFLEYIKDPKAKIPGTKMIFAGIKNEKEVERSLGVHRAVRQGRQDQVKRQRFCTTCRAAPRSSCALTSSSQRMHDHRPGHRGSRPGQ